MNGNKDSFIFYRSFYEATKILPDKKRLKIYEMIIELGLNDVRIEEKDSLVQSLFLLIEPQISANNKRYLDGKKGGRPRNSSTEITTSISDEDLKELEDLAGSEWLE